MAAVAVLGVLVESGRALAPMAHAAPPFAFWTKRFRVKTASAKSPGRPRFFFFHEDFNREESMF
jgi:hypothetical protein